MANSPVRLLNRG